MEEEVLEKYKVEEAKKSANNGRGEPPEWRITKKRKRGISFKNRVMLVGREFSHGSQNTACSETKV